MVRRVADDSLPQRTRRPSLERLLPVESLRQTSRPRRRPTGSPPVLQNHSSKRPDRIGKSVSSIPNKDFGQKPVCTSQSRRSEKMFCSTPRTIAFQLWTDSFRLRPVHALKGAPAHTFCTSSGKGKKAPVFRNIPFSTRFP